METVINEETLRELAELGVIYGHKKSKTHPSMKPVVIDNRNEMELLNPEAVISSLNKAIDFMKERMKGGALFLFVGTTPVAKESSLSLAEKFSFPYVISRWLGGTLTNFKSIHKRISYYEDLKSKKEKGELEKYTKKERLGFTKEIEKMKEKFEGLIRLTKLPDVIFVVNIGEHETAVKEANQLGIPIVAIIDNDDDSKIVQHPIYASDHTKKSVDWILSKVEEGLSEVKNEVVSQPAESEEKEAKNDGADN